MHKNKLDNNLILIVDDSPEIISMMNDTITNAGMTSFVALEGSQAITIALKIIPDLILLDALMPNMDGFETCQKIKSYSKLKEIPVIFMTGLKDTESIVKGFQVGGTDYLTKPINPDELIARIQVHTLNAKKAISTKTALDISGQNIFALDQSAKLIWATPQVEKILLEISATSKSQFEKSMRQWLEHNPEEGNRLHMTLNNEDLTAVYLGDSESNEKLIKLVIENSHNEKNILMKQFNITSRESDVLYWLAKGKANREIAEILNMSHRTVGKHMEQLFRKLEVDNRTVAAMRAMESLLKNH